MKDLYTKYHQEFFKQNQSEKSIDFFREIIKRNIKHGPMGDSMSLNSGTK